jgi:hypothetical protein
VVPDSVGVAGSRQEAHWQTAGVGCVMFFQQWQCEALQGGLTVGGCQAVQLLPVSRLKVISMCWHCDGCMRGPVYMEDQQDLYICLLA